MSTPKFYPNWDDDLHCLQASLMIVFDFINKPKTWDWVNQETGFINSNYSWTIVGAVVLMNEIKGVTFISGMNIKKFASEGKAYLKNEWWADRHERYKDQKKHASVDFNKEQVAARNFLTDGKYENRQISLNNLEVYLEEYIVIAMVNPCVMKGLSGEGSHFIVVYEQNTRYFIVHDPGLPPAPEFSVEKGMFMKAFEGDMILIPKPLGRNNPCPCGSGKKWKKCHYPDIPA